MSSQKLWEMLTGYRTTQMLIVAARAGVADELAHGPRSVADLAAAASVNADALYRVLRGLASLGVFREVSDRHFELTPLAEGLRSDVPGSARSAALLYAETSWWEAWGHMYESVQTGKTAFDAVHGEELFEFLNRHPAVAARFNAHMVAGTEVEARLVVAAYDFSRAGRIIDVGGGHGILLGEILRTHPNLQAALFDQAAVVAGAPSRLQQVGVADRCALLSGDFFAAVPDGFDTYLLKSIIHDWEDERALLILRNCRRAMKGNETLLLVEHIVTRDNQPNVGKIWDMTMLVITGGLERTRDEHELLLRTAGFRISNVVPMPSGASVLEALPV